LKNIVFILLGLLLSSCSMLHKSQSIGPPADMPEMYQYSQKTNTDYFLDNWWENFNNPQLNQFMEETFTGNLDIKQLVAKMKQAQALYQQSRAGSLPWLNLEGSGGRRRQPGFSGSVTDSVYQGNLVAGYEIDIWGKIKSRQEAAFLRSEASKAAIRSMILSLSAQVAETWFRLSELQEQLQLTDAIIGSRADNLNLVEMRYKSGLISSLDVYQARQSLSNARTKRPQYIYDLKTSEHALTVLAGKWPGEHISTSSWELPDISSSFPVGLPSDLLKNRPDVEAAYLELQATDYDLAAAVANRFPSFSLTGSYGGSSNELHNLLNNSNILWNALLSVSQSLFDAGNKKQETKRVQYVFEEHLAAYHQAILVAFQDVTDALAAEEEAKTNLVLQNNLHDAALKTLKVSEDQYKEGLVDYLNILTAQTSYNESQRNLVSARRKQISARISLARALGGSWMDHEIKN
jgi:NodT family efflux transporter outer membrane factor (OMF) lipoprotein